MKLSVILISFLVAFSFLNQSFAEVYTTGSAADNSGNIIVIGYCLGNVAIGGEQFNITTPSAFILKLNSDGEKIWVRFINSTQSIKANAIAVDSAGNIYITGEFSGTANFGSNSLFAQNADAFIIKLNVDGEVEWVKQGTSINSATGNDIFVKGNFVYVCGNGKPISFDTLSNVGGGYTVIYYSDGNIFNLFQTNDQAYKLSIDKNNDIVLYLGHYDTMWNSYWSLLSKYSNTGNELWTAPHWLEHNQSLCMDSNNIIYNVAGFPSSGISLRKFDNSGNQLLYTNFGPSNSSHSGKDVIFTNNTSVFCGYYSSGFQFGNTTLLSNGSIDFFIAAVDTNLEPVWINHGGGSYADELNSILQIDEGSIVCSGNFEGTISIDTIQITGGISANDIWVGIIKFDSSGNTILVEKIAENFSPPDTTDWFSLEIGNNYQYFKKFSNYWGIEYGDYSIKLFQVTDSVWINNKKYFSVDGFYWFNSGTKIRYDKESQQILVVYNNQEYLFMDFSKVAGETFQQTNGAGGYHNATIISQNFMILEDSVEAKGFYIVRRLGGGGGMPYGDLVTSVYFAPEIGWIFQDEENYITALPKTDLILIEYLKFKEGPRIHKKHSEIATIIFQPVTFISTGDSLFQEFIILHPFSKQNVPASHGYFSYIKNSYLQSFYYNGADTIWNSYFNIPQTDVTDFTLNYQFDTTKYNQGYHLYYRIAAVDKGIVADTFYSPQTGYYKLFWKDSTTSVTQIEFEALTYSLSQNYPNPFNPVSKIVFTIPKRENVSLKVYDILGSEISTLVNKELDAGKYEVDFSGKNLSSGIYIYQIKAGVFRETKKMILMR